MGSGGGVGSGGADSVESNEVEAGLFFLKKQHYMNYVDSMVYPIRCYCVYVDWSVTVFG